MICALGTLHQKSWHKHGGGGAKDHFSGVKYRYERGFLTALAVKKSDFTAKLALMSLSSPEPIIKNFDELVPHRFSMVLKSIVK